MATDVKQTLGTLLKYPGGGIACYCGFRPRDDQSQSLGYETRTMFEILNACNAYPSTGKFNRVNDNPSFISRTSNYFVSSFPNGATMLVNHYRTHIENWPGGFSRNDKQDEEILKNNPFPTDSIRVQNEYINGHQVTYEGRLMVGFNTENNRLIAFLGQRCKGITLDGKSYHFAAAPLSSISFGPLLGDKNHYQVFADGQQEIMIPLPSLVKSVNVSCEDEKIPAILEGNNVKISMPKKFYGHAVDIFISGDKHSK